MCGASTVDTVADGSALARSVRGRRPLLSCRAVALLLTGAVRALTGNVGSRANPLLASAFSGRVLAILILGTRRVLIEVQHQATGCRGQAPEQDRAQVEDLL